MVTDIRELDKWTVQYIETALWSSTDESREDGGDPMDDNYSLEDLAPETLAAMVADCDRFRDVAGEMLDEHHDPTMAAHDFWLTRNPRNFSPHEYAAQSCVLVRVKVTRVPRR